MVFKKNHQFFIASKIKCVEKILELFFKNSSINVKSTLECSLVHILTLEI
jgi:hypothetical protein